MKKSAKKRGGCGVAKREHERKGHNDGVENESVVGGGWWHIKRGDNGEEDIAAEGWQRQRKESARREEGSKVTEREWVRKRARESVGKGQCRKS
ncbi:hypothetical protein VNO78_31311 [Psophocarpus tetragonolobus]|uniref:Uncharacterized protein n=1 Tax=Psophocarpus tetragonolobus TaxID=3891 RepID=A0AAN9RY66_PSOTE